MQIFYFSADNLFSRKKKQRTFNEYEFNLTTDY